MIGFCEDCGAKNTLGRDAASQGAVQFTCSVCGYPNAYALPGSPEMPEQLSQVIATCPDIIAAFSVQKGGRPVILRLPKGLTPSDMAQLGHHLTTGFRSASAVFPGIREQTVSIADKHITVTRAGCDAFLILICSTPALPERVSDLFQTLREGTND